MMKERLIIFIFFFNIAGSNLILQDNKNNYIKYSTAVYKYKTGNIKEAQELFQDFFTNNPYPTLQSIKEYLMFLFNTEQFSKFEEIYKKYTTKINCDSDLEFLYAKILKKTGNIQQANTILEKLSKDNRPKIEILYELILEKIEKKDFLGALEILEKLLDENIQAKSNYIFYLILAKINISLNKFNNAKIALEKALNLYPDFNEGWLLFALINSELNDINNAIHGYKRFLDITGKNNSIENEILKLKVRRNTQSQAMLAESRLAYNSRDYSKALEMVNKVLNNDPDDIDAKLLKIEILLAFQKVKQAIDLINKEISLNKNPNFWLQLLYTISGVIKDKNYLKKSLKQIANNRQDINLYIYISEIFNNIGDPENSIKYAQKTLKLVQDIEIKSHIIFHIASIYYKQKDFKKLGGILNSEFLDKTNYGPLINLAAYYYATKANNLELAQKLSNRALRISPENPHYLDTKAKVLYKQKKYRESLEILEKIAKLLPEDKIIKANLEKTKTKFKIYEK